DDCCAGPRIQDVWMIFDSDEPISEMFWRGYEQYLPAPYDQIRLIPVLRRMRQLHFAAWCAVQTDERQFQSTFPDWGNATYWRQLHSELESGIIELERGRS
ncbi:hypothetical protein EBR96_08485, partial [bacterium]|nr:hypothetical protein [bacterium]